MIETCTNDIEEVIKYVLIQSQFKLKKKQDSAVVTTMAN